MKCLFGSSKRAFVWLALLIAVMVLMLGWEQPPWNGRVCVCRSEYDTAKIPCESSLRVEDAIGRSRKVLGEAARDRVVLYQWRYWMPERVPDATVMGMQCTLKALGLYVWADALWWRWDAIVPRQFAWREVARDGEARQRLVKPGDMVVLHRVH